MARRADWTYRQPRLWPVAGAVLGLGLTNKHSIAFFALALCVGTVVSHGSAILRNRFFAVGAVIALLFAVPDLWWQAAHHWPTIGMTRALAQENGGLKNAIVFIPTQLVMASPVLIGVWLAGLRFLWRSERPLWRGLAWSYGLLFIFFAVTTGVKPYYLAGRILLPYSGRSGDPGAALEGEIAPASQPVYGTRRELRRRRVVHSPDTSG